MNTYDFDKTIYFTDSSAQFYRWCFRLRPSAFLRTLPLSAWKAILYAAKKISTKELKQQLFSFLKNIDDIDTMVEQFWQEKKGGIYKWYLLQKKEDDVIISASPEFLLAPICRELGVALIATPMDKRTGEITGENCHDWEKVRRFRQEYPGMQTEEFYSDSLTDFPMARVAQRAYLVSGETRSPWPEEK